MKLSTILNLTTSKTYVSIINYVKYNKFLLFHKNFYVILYNTYVLFTVTTSPFNCSRLQPDEHFQVDSEKNSK